MTTEYPQTEAINEDYVVVALDIKIVRKVANTALSDYRKLSSVINSIRGLVNDSTVFTDEITNSYEVQHFLSDLLSHMDEIHNVQRTKFHL